jgi:NADPH:quinone reductase-like Zn-dependent oxidoreductase
MRAVQLISYGVVAAADVTDPVLLPGTILVDVFAAGVNPFDWKLAKGVFAQTIPLTLPVTLGGDFSGVVRDPGDSEFNVGDEVFGQGHVLGGGSGSFAETLSVNNARIALKPKRIDHAHAAALPLVGVSALDVLVGKIEIQQGQKILIHGGAGGIGSIAIQIARHFGAAVTTTATAEEAPYVKGLGAEIIVDYTKSKFEEVLSNGGYDAVFDTVGGETYRTSFQVLKKGGVIVSMLEEPHQELMAKFGVRALHQSTDITKPRLIELAKLVEDGALKINIDKIFPLAEAASALTYLETGHPKGKVIVKIQ